MEIDTTTSEIEPSIEDQALLEFIERWELELEIFNEFG